MSIEKFLPTPTPLRKDTHSEFSTPSISYVTEVVDFLTNKKKKKKPPSHPPIEGGTGVRDERQRAWERGGGQRALTEEKGRQADVSLHVIRYILPHPPPPWLPTAHAHFIVRCTRTTAGLSPAQKRAQCCPKNSFFERDEKFVYKKRYLSCPARRGVSLTLSTPNSFSYKLLLLSCRTAADAGLLPSCEDETFL